MNFGDIIADSPPDKSGGFQKGRAYSTQRYSQLHKHKKYVSIDSFPAEDIFVEVTIESDNVLIEDPGTFMMGVYQES